MSILTHPICDQIPNIRSDPQYSTKLQSSRKEKLLPYMIKVRALDLDACTFDTNLCCVDA